MSEDEQAGRWETTPSELKAEVRTLRAALDGLAKQAEWFLAGDDPHDWRKGLAVVRDLANRAVGDSNVRTRTD